MRLFRRVGDVLSANVNDLIDRFEDPEKMLRQAISEMEQAVASALRRAAKVVATERLLAKEAAENQRQAEQWRDQARQAVRDGDDSLARRALARKAEHERLLQTLEVQQAAAEQASRKLRRQIDAMRGKLAIAKRNLASLAARNRAAEARRQLLALEAPEAQEAAFAKFDRLRRRVEMAEAEADALADLMRCEDERSAADESQLEAELAALKAESRPGGV